MRKVVSLYSETLRSGGGYLKTTAATGLLVLPAYHCLSKVKKRLIYPKVLLYVA